MGKVQSLPDFIREHFNGNQSEFARAQKVPRQRVAEWIAKDFVVIDGTLYSKRRDLVLAESGEIKAKA